MATAEEPGELQEEVYEGYEEEAMEGAEGGEEQPTGETPDVRG